jgi:hypothetical protein
MFLYFLMVLEIPGRFNIPCGLIWTHPGPDWLYQNTSRLLFQQYNGGVQEKSNVSWRVIYNVLQDYFIQNRLEKLCRWTIIQYDFHFLSTNTNQVLSKTRPVGNICFFANFVFPTTTFYKHLNQHLSNTISKCKFVNQSVSKNKKRIGPNMDPSGPHWPS